MLKEVFIGKRISHFELNPVVKAFIVSEMLIWSAWNLIMPIFAVFAANEISGGSVEVAASSFSVFLIVRVVFELISGKYLARASDYKKFLITIFGLLTLSVSYLGFSQSLSIAPVFFFFGLAGMGLGIASPAKSSLFTEHLNKNKEAEEWSIYDALSLISMAIATSLGGFIAKDYGFRSLFYIATFTTLIGIVPYILFITSDLKTSGVSPRMKIVPAGRKRER